MIDRTNRNVKEDIKKINKQLRKYFADKGFNYMESFNVNESCLNKNRSALNKRERSMFSQNKMVIAILLNTLEDTCVK